MGGKIRKDQKNEKERKIKVKEGQKMTLKKIGNKV